MTSFTKDAIKKSFLKLLNEKPFNKITVKDIVQDCGINRNSFYYHFDDIPSLLDEILTDETDEILHNRSAPDSVYDCVMSVIDFAQKNKTAVLHIYNSVNREMFEQYINRGSEHVVTEYLKSAFEIYNINDEDREIVVKYYKCQVVGFVLDWLSGGMKYDICAKLKRMCEIFSGTMEQVLKKCSSDAII